MIAKLLLIFLLLTAATPLPAAATDPFDELVDAIRGDAPERVERLLDADPSLAGVHRDGRSAVVAAIFATKPGQGFQDVKRNPILQRVMARKPKLDLFETAALGSAADLNKMLRPGAVKERNQFGWTPLHLAAFAGNVETARVLLDRGADIHERAKTKFRNNPLLISLLTGQYEMAKFLLDRGADVLDRQAKGFTAMHEAAFTGHRQAAELLLERGAEINSRTDDGRTPLSEALRAGHSDLAEWLRSKGAVAGQIGDDVMKRPAE